MYASRVCEPVPMETDLADRLRAICMGLPEVTERPSHGAPTWFVRDKKSFVTLWADGHHTDDFAHLLCAALPCSCSTSRCRASTRG